MIDSHRDQQVDCSRLQAGTYSVVVVVLWHLIYFTEKRDKIQNSTVIWVHGGFKLLHGTRHTAHSCCCCSEICNPISDIRIWNVKFMSAKRINIISMSSTHAQTPTGHSDTSPFPPAPTHLSLCFFLWVPFGLFALLVSCCLLLVMYSV
jgi:hypothetical protein